jgi:hypothetical protein
MTDLSIETAITRLVAGAIRDCINHHGPVTPDNIGSAAKRVTMMLLTRCDVHLSDYHSTPERLDRKRFRSARKNHRKNYLALRQMGAIAKECPVCWPKIMSGRRPVDGSAVWDREDAGSNPAAPTTDPQSGLPR